MDTRVITLCALAIGAGACAAPVKHPRTADVLDARELRLRVGTVLFAVAPSTAVLQSGDDSLTASGEYSDPWTARQLRSRWVVLDSVVGLLASAEAQAAYSLFDGCEGGATLSLLRIGAELRCGVLDEDRGAPLSAALSAGAALQVGFIIGSFVDKERERDGRRPLAPAGSELHAGLDLSTRLHGVTPLINVNVGYGRQMRDVLSGLPGGFESYDHWSDEIGNILVARDELRLSIPVGFALEYERLRGRDQRSRVILAVVPELTLQAWNRWAIYAEVPGSVVVDLEQHWALYLTLAAETEW